MQRKRFSLPDQHDRKYSDLLSHIKCRANHSVRPSLFKPHGPILELVFQINIAMSHTEDGPVGPRKIPEGSRNENQENNSELLSFEHQPEKGPGEESDVLKNAMNPLESRTAKPTNSSDERKTASDETNSDSSSAIPPCDSGFINIEAED